MTPENVPLCIQTLLPRKIRVSDSSLDWEWVDTEFAVKIINYHQRHLRHYAHWRPNDDAEWEELMSYAHTAIYLGASNALAHQFLTEEGFDPGEWLVNARETAKKVEKAFDSALVQSTFPAFSEYAQTALIDEDVILHHARRVFYEMTCGRHSLQFGTTRQRKVNLDVDYLVDPASFDDIALATLRESEDPLLDLVLTVADQMFMWYGPHRGIYETLERIYFPKEYTQLMMILSRAGHSMTKKEFERKVKALARRLSTGSSAFQEYLKTDPAIREIYNRIVS